jgi:hypothetical protein
MSTDWLEDYLALTDNTEPPDIFRRWVGISCLASVLQRKVYLSRSDDLTIYPNLYIVLVAPPGKARKGTSMKVGFKLLTEPAMQVVLSAEATTREALIRALNNSRLFYRNNEGFEIPHSSLTIYSPELAVFLGNGSTQMYSDLTDWYDCRDVWNYETKQKETSDELRNVWVNLIGATTPALIQKTIPPDAIGGGLSSRMIFIYANRKGKIVPNPKTTDSERTLRADLLTRLEEIHLLAGEFQTTPAYEELWEKWYVSIEDKPPFQDDKFAGYFERRPEIVLKLSLIMHVSREPTKIVDDVDLARAIYTLEQAEVSMPRALRGVGQNTYATIIARVIEVVSRAGSMKYSELLSLFLDDVMPTEFDDILVSLEKTGCILWFQNTGEVRLAD